jgi:hypothetical protein
MKMADMKSTPPLFSLFIAAAACLSSVAHAGPVKLVSVETKAALPPEAEDIVFGQHPEKGAEVKATFLLWPDVGAAIVEIHEKKCRVTETVDSATGQPVKVNVEFGSFPKLAKDGSIGSHSLEYTLPEEPGSGRLKISGTLAVTTATGVKTEKPDGFALADEAKLKAGDLNLEVTGLKNDDGKTKFGLKSSKPMSAIKDIRFFRPDGTPVESRRNGRSWGRMFGSYSETWQIELETEIKDVKIEFDLHQNLAEKEIPFDFALPSAL